MASDTLNLLAVDEPTSARAGEGDAATWQPPNKAYRCVYVARHIAVTARDGLSVTLAEHEAVARIVATCPSQKVYTDTRPLPKVKPVTQHPSRSAGEQDRRTAGVGCYEVRELRHAARELSAWDWSIRRRRSHVRHAGHRLPCQRRVLQRQHQRDRDDGTACEAY